MTWPAKVVRTLEWISGQASAKDSCAETGILSVYLRGGVQERRSSGFRSMMSRSETPAALATTESSVAEGISTSAYSLQASRSISSALKPKASGCLAMMAAAMSLGT